LIGWSEPWICAPTAETIFLPEFPATLGAEVWHL